MGFPVAVHIERFMVPYFTWNQFYLNSIVINHFMLYLKHSKNHKIYSLIFMQFLCFYKWHRFGYRYIGSFAK